MSTSSGSIIIGHAASPSCPGDAIGYAIGGEDGGTEPINVAATGLLPSMLSCSSQPKPFSSGYRRSMKKRSLNSLLPGPLCSSAAGSERKLCTSERRRGVYRTETCAVQKKMKGSYPGKMLLSGPSVDGVGVDEIATPPSVT